jgi:hypothetical protein
VVDDPMLIGSEGPHEPDEVTILLANTWEEDAGSPRWSFEYTPLLVTDAEQERNLILLNSMYEVQAKLIELLCRMFGAGVDLTCYRP